MITRFASTGRTTAFALALGLLFQACAPNVIAHDFGGSSGGGGGGPPPPPPPPCDNPCDCGGPGGGSGGGGGGGGGPPPNRSGSPISYWNGGESIFETDMVVGGTFPIVIARTYDSLSTFDSPLGFGWSFAHDRSLYEYPDGSAVVRYSCGTRDRYVPSGGAYVSPVGGMLAGLVHQPDGSWSLSYVNGTRDTFDSLGRLTGFYDIRGNRHEYTYDAGGKFPLTGTSPAAVTPGTPMVVAYHHRLTRIDERGVDGALTGRYSTFSYDPATGRLASVTSDDGRTVSYAHDVTAGLTKGNLTQVTGLGGVDRAYAYADPNDQHNLTSIIDAPGRTPIVNTYDDQDRVTRQEEGTRRIDFNYQVPLARTIVTRTIRDQSGLNPYTTALTYEFDSTGRITRIADALGHEQRYIYNSAKLLERKETWQNNSGTLALLQATQWTYDTAGHRLSQAVTLDSGEVVTRSWTYDHDSVASEQVVSSGAPLKVFRTEFTFNYDANGRPITIAQQKRRKDDGSFQTTAYTYDTRNRLLTTTLPDGVEIVNEYTGDYLTKNFFRVGGVAIPQGTRRYDYDGAGNLIKEWDARNNLTQTSFDSRGRPLVITNPLGTQTLYTYSGDLLTHVEKGRTVADGEGQVTRLSYDARGRRTSIERKNDAGTFVTYYTFELDSEGRQLSAIDALGRKSRLAYDVLGRVSSVTDALNKVTQFGYDAAGNRISVIDALAHEVRFEFDDLNRLRAKVELGTTPNPRTEYVYDAAGNLVSLADAEGHATSYVFDALSRNTTITQALGQGVQFSYDNRDRIDYLVNARGHKIDYGYESWGPVIEEKQYASTTPSAAVRSIGYSYDADGNLTGIVDDAIQAGPAYAMTYDELGRLYDETIKYLPGGDRTLSRRYDRYGNRKDLTLQDGGTVTSTYSYNKLNRLASASLAGSAVTLGHFANDERQSITTPNGVTETYAYKSNGPLDSITLVGPSGQLSQLSYAYDDALNLDSETDSLGLHDYAYDALNRLTAATRPVGSGLSNEAYAYDRVGNREQPGSPALYAYDNNNRITSSPGLTYTSDADGNLLSRSDGAAYTHDYRGRLAQFALGSSNSSYLHDATGRRIRKTVNGVQTWFLWDGTKLLAEYDGGGVRRKRYAYLESDVAPLQVQDGNGTYYVHSDHLQAPRLMTNAAGAVVWRGRYQAFGAAVVDEDPDGNAVSVSLNIRLPGQYFDAESALHYNYFRDYDPALGRYVQSDPFGLRGGSNTYLYAAARPTVDTDRYGLFLDATGLYTGGRAVVVVVEAGAAAGGAAVGAAAAAAVVLPVVAYLLYEHYATEIQDVLDELLREPEKQPEQKTQEEIEREQKADRDAYHKVCDARVPPGLDKCGQLRWKLQKALDCMRMRQAYIDKWNDTYPGHPDQVEQRRKEAEKLQKQIDKECCGK